MKTPTFLLLALSTFGCAQQMDSEDVRTSGIRAEFEVVAFGGDSNAPTEASAILRGGSDPLRLTGNDRLEVIQVGGDTKTMTRRSGAHDYLAHFGNVREEGTEFVFAFLRGPDDTDAPDTQVTLPPPFVVQGLESNGEVPRSSNLVLTWEEDHTNDQVNYEIAGGSGTCVRRRVVNNAGTNNGTLVIPADHFALSAGSSANETCGARLFVELERVGTRDPAYKEATIRAKQRYWIQFVSTP